MAIGVVFNYAGEIVETRVVDSSLYFRTSGSQMYAGIEGIRLDKNGVIKEHPDLADNKDWKIIAQQRLKDKIKQMKSENEIAQYVVKELSKLGYRPLYMQKSGHRPVKL